MKTTPVFFIVGVMSGMLTAPVEAGLFSWLFDQARTLQNGNTLNTGEQGSFKNHGSGTQTFTNAKINHGGGGITNVKIDSAVISGEGRQGINGGQGSFKNHGSGTQTFTNAKINHEGSFVSFGSSSGTTGGGANGWDSDESSAGSFSEDESSFGNEGSNGWDFGTSHSFNNHGSGNLVNTGTMINSGFNFGNNNINTGAVINSGLNFGNNNVITSSNGVTTMTSGKNTMTFTGNNKQAINFGVGFGSWQTTWDGSVYNVKIQRKQDGNKKCTEDMWIIGREDKLEKHFDLECLANGQSRNVNNAGQVLLVGEQKGDFCAFTSKRNELYYMQKRKWKKCSFKNENIQEHDMTSNELAKVKERITKWEVLFEKNHKEIERIGQMQGEAGNKYGEKMRKIGDMQRAEGDKTRRNNAEIRTLWQQEAQRQRGDQQKLNDVGRSTGWGSAYNRLLKEQQSRMNREQDRINQIQNDENERYNRENEKYTRMMEEERIKYEEECTKFEKLREQEAIRFDKELKLFINNGW